MTFHETSRGRTRVPHPAQAVLPFVCPCLSVLSHASPLLPGLPSAAPAMGALIAPHAHVLWISLTAIPLRRVLPPGPRASPLPPIGIGNPAGSTIRFPGEKESR